jgi:hypothetical protein
MNEIAETIGDNLPYFTKVEILIFKELSTFVLSYLLVNNL